VAQGALSAAGVPTLLDTAVLAAAEAPAVEYAEPPELLPGRRALVLRAGRTFRSGRRPWAVA
jgi:hypothetical protein